MIEGIPLPATEAPHEVPFWEGLRAGRLCMQRCRACLRWQFPPLLRCGECGGAIEWAAVSGRGRIWSMTEIHPPVLPAFAPFTPYLVAVVALEEAETVRMVGNLIREPADPINRVRLGEVMIGQPVEAVIEALSGGVYWPRWRPL